MKNKLKLLACLTITTAVFVSCKKEIARISYLGGTAPVLTASKSGTIPLSNTTKGNVAVTLSWTNPNYQFTTGESSQNVSYLLEIDTLGANFTNPNKYQTVFSPDLGVPYVDSVLNAALTNGLRLVVGIPHTIQIRVTASINSAAPTILVSNVLQFTVTPWSPPPAVNPPSSGTLYIVGDAVGSWNNPIDASNLPKQQFTKVSNTLYQITVPINGNGEYKFIGVNSSWNDQWSIKTEQPSGDPTTLSFPLYFNGANCRAPATNGTYKIVVDFQFGTVTLTKQ